MSLCEDTLATLRRVAAAFDCEFDMHDRDLTVLRLEVKITILLLEKACVARVPLLDLRDCYRFRNEAETLADARAYRKQRKRRKAAE